MKKTILLLLYMLVIVILLSSCATVGWEHGSKWRLYANRGWLQIDISDVNRELSGYSRLLNEMEFDKGVKNLIQSKGLPDYINVPGYNLLYLAYVKTGTIYQFPSVSAFGSTPIETHYSKVPSLPSHIREKCQEQDPTYTKNTTIPIKSETVKSKPLLPASQSSSAETSSSAIIKPENKVLPKVAVWDLSSGDIKPSYSQDLTSILVSEITKVKKYEVYSQENVRTLAGWTAERMKLGCTDSQCLTALGQMDIAKLISGRIGKIGDTYSISLNLFDSQNVRAEKSISEFCRSENELIGLLQQVVSKLLSDAP